MSVEALSHLLAVSHCPRFVTALKASTQFLLIIQEKTMFYKTKGRKIRIQNYTVQQMLTFFCRKNK